MVRLHGCDMISVPNTVDMDMINTGMDSQPLDLYLCVYVQLYVSVCPRP